MIFEILGIVLFIGFMLFALIQYFKKDRLDTLPIALAFMSLMFALMLGGLALSGATSDESILNNLEPIEKVPLEVFDGSYAIKNSGHDYYFKYENKIVHSKTCILINLNETTETQAVVYRCHIKSSLWVGRLFSLTSGYYYVLVLPFDQIRNNSYTSPNLPGWLEPMD